MIVMEMTPVEYQAFAVEGGYAIEREGVRHDFIRGELVQAGTDTDTVLDQWVAGEFAYDTDTLPPNLQD